MDRISDGEGAESFQIRPRPSVDQAPRLADGVANVDESSDLQLHAEQEAIAGVDSRFLAWQRQAGSEHECCEPHVIVEASSDDLQRITGRLQELLRTSVQAEQHPHLRLIGGVGACEVSADSILLCFRRVLRQARSEEVIVDEGVVGRQADQVGSCRSTLLLLHLRDCFFCR